MKELRDVEIGLEPQGEMTALAAKMMELVPDGITALVLVSNPDGRNGISMTMDLMEDKMIVAYMLSHIMAICEALGISPQDIRAVMATL